MKRFFVKLMLGSAGSASNAFLFLSAISLSLAINIYTGLFSAPKVPCKFYLGVWSVVAGILGAAAWSYLAWAVDELAKLGTGEAQRRSPDNPDEERVQLERFIGSGIRRLSVAFFLGAVLLVTALALVPYSS